MDMGFEARRWKQTTEKSVMAGTGEIRYGKQVFRQKDSICENYGNRIQSL